MTLESIIDMIVSNGLSAIIIGYFIFKDYKQSGQMLEAMNRTNEQCAVNTSVMTELKEILTIVKERLFSHE